jgi:hypothetical protein
MYQDSASTKQKFKHLGKARAAPFNMNSQLRRIVEFDADRTHVDIVRRESDLPLEMTLCPTIKET